MRWQRFLSALCRLACLLIGLLAMHGAHAHLMPAGHGGVRIDGNTAMSVISVPVSALSGWDDDGNGRLSLMELNIHREALLAQLAGKFKLFNDTKPEQILFQDMLFTDLKNEALSGAVQIVLMRRSAWEAKVGELRVEAKLFAASGPERKLSISAVRGNESELNILHVDHAGHTFFRGPLSAFADAARLGAEHILIGFDHLLFLLTLLVAGAGWRYWAGTITAFTIAHSITLALAAYGVVRIPEAIVEPLIAASIVLLALDNLLRNTAAIRHRIVLVFACGLLHGLGIASALTDLGLAERGRLLGLTGFNVGVELGQFLFIAVALSLFALARRWGPAGFPMRLGQACSVFAALVGSGWFLARIFNSV